MNSFRFDCTQTGVHPVATDRAAAPPPRLATSGRVEKLERQLFPRIRARYDAAQVTTENEKHWAWADNLSAERANSPGVRRRLRSHSRYECHESNSLAKGMALTLTDAVIGSGPQLQVNHTDKEKARAIERGFTRWAREIRLGEKLRTAKTAKTVDGESFITPVNNERLRHQVKLDLRLNEAEQIATPGMLPLGRQAVDGIVFDEFGNPDKYHRLKEHPGGVEGLSLADPNGVDEIDADQMIHIFRCDRPGQKRGVPEFTPALPWFAMLRRYGLAVLAAAETAADIAGVIYTDA